MKEKDLKNINDLAGVNWYLWPTHWAGGSNSIQVDGINTVWIQGDAGEVARMTPIEKRITPHLYKRAALIASAPQLLAERNALKTALERLVTYIDQFRQPLPCSTNEEFTQSVEQAKEAIKFAEQ